MDRQYIDDHHVVARYLADQLDERERAAFEAHMDEHPEIVKELEAAARFKVGLMQMHDSGELATLLQPPPAQRERRYLAVAALLAVLIGGYFLFHQAAPQMLAASLENLQGSTGPFASANTHLILRTRGSVYDAEVELPEPGRAIELRVRPELEPPPARYRITFSRLASDDSLELLGQIDAVEPVADGFVPIYLDPTQLTPGLYQLSIGSDVGVNAAEQPTTFVIKLRRR